LYSRSFSKAHSDKKIINFNVCKSSRSSYGRRPMCSPHRPSPDPSQRRSSPLLLRPRRPCAAPSPRSHCLTVCLHRCSLVAAPSPPGRHASLLPHLLLSHYPRQSAAGKGEGKVFVASAGRLPIELHRDASSDSSSASSPKFLPCQLPLFHHHR
jgi:hypothetical protein